MTAPSALPGLDAIRRRADHLPLSVPDRHEHAMDVVRLVAAVEALPGLLAAVARVRMSAEPTSNPDANEDVVSADALAALYLAANNSDAALAPFRTRDVTADEVPQKLIDDVRAAGLATAHLGDEAWGGDEG